ncbi:MULTISPECIES: 4'-phosphopantetheinyl transferase family protein [Rhizobium]|uniref:4'-phosphopantetheinyl transferase n=1 Tax=Rhizobium tropici TaxID=398 RepID=A0A6P1C930_RHITR|nr:MULTISPECIES: 4'-phosphopantetheinyl transferase superfamily protein [Rhizobium]AGB74147.1 putative phosphopantetheinyltransferase family protein [Rhizobium tropici CIAT 899]MBB4240632.1 4'-phosphopantetheinyl transferase [Rhizobium tropici]MBB5591951.1 4'-phosphopantetheinyl transferase [Rhizobium tropici]MBB6491005.1 4'-phosphopantetheinyl transferase [Rhizobium tropici]NEV12662.1 4'-phosphopantetheinyl transferase superfamily protein [Rhizobium tropici]
MTAPRFEVVLAVADAIAVLVRPMPDGRAERDQIAQTALREATQRDDLSIYRRPSERPALRHPYHELGVSLSHRTDLLLAGYSPHSAVGVDIEVEDINGFDPVAFAADHFSPKEAAAVAALDSAAALEICYRLWVAKEAALKISGRGIFDGLDEPDLAAQLNLLRTDGATIHLGTGSRLPPIALAVTRLAGAADQPIYCALARDMR